MFLVLSDTFLIYKQLSTQGTLTSCSQNELDAKNHWVIQDLENPQALSSTLAALGHYSPGPSSFLNPIEPWYLTSNYYLGWFKPSSYFDCRGAFQTVLESYCCVTALNIADNEA